MTCTLKGKHLASNTGAKNPNGVNDYPTKAAKMSWGKCVGTSGSLYELLMKIEAQRDQNMAHLLLWLLLIWIIWPVNYCIAVLETTANLLRENVFASPNSTLIVVDEQWGLCWDSHENQSCPPDALSETTAHPSLKKEMLMSMTLITDSRTTWPLVQIPEK